MDGRTECFHKKRCSGQKRIEKSSKGLKKKEEWPPLLANNKGAARAQFEMIEERDASDDIKQNSTAAHLRVWAVQQQLLLGGVVCVYNDNVARTQGPGTTIRKTIFHADWAEPGLRVKIIKPSDKTKNRVLVLFLLSRLEIFLKRLENLLTTVHKKMAPTVHPAQLVADKRARPRPRKISTDDNNNPKRR
jgi:hypothetical protein